MNKFETIKQNKSIIIRRVLLGTAVVAGVVIASGLIKIRVTPSETAAHLAEGAANGIEHVADVIAQAAE